MKSLSFHVSQSQGGGGEVSDLFRTTACFSASVSSRKDTVNCSRQQHKNYLLLLTFRSPGVEFLFSTTKLPKFAWTLAVGEGGIEKGKETGRIQELQCKIYAYGERKNTTHKEPGSPQILQARSLHGHDTGPLLSRNCQLPSPLTVKKRTWEHVL